MYMRKDTTSLLIFVHKADAKCMRIIQGNEKLL